MFTFKKHILVAISMLIVLIALSACGNSNQSNEEKKTTEVATEQTQHEAANEAVNTDNQENVQTSYPLQVVDMTETTINLEQEPVRIVTLVPSETEIVFAIDGEDKLVGVNAYSDYPQEALLIETIGDAAINIEAVVALEPDLVLASYSMNNPYIDALRDLGVTVYVSEPKTYEDTAAHIEKVGLMLNKQAEAVKISTHMRQVREEIEQKVADVPSPKVYLEFSPGWTVGGDEYLDELITIAGGQNISQAQTGWYEVNGEAVIEANPNVIIYPNFGEEVSSILTAIQTRPGWDVIDAIKQNRLVEVSNEPLVRVGPRLAQGLEEIAKAIHPELFN